MTPLEIALFLLEKGLTPAAISKQAALIKEKKATLLVERHLPLFQKDFYLLEQLCRASRTPPARWVEELIERSIDHTKATYPLQTAVITALFTPLRQSIGSCFASACAIFVQFHNPDQMVQDLIDLLTQGFLKRIDQDTLFHYPLCPAENLLKAWEFTIASMSGNRNQLLRWNLSHILGIQSDSPLSLGAMIHQKGKETERLLEQEARKVQEEVLIEKRQLELYESMTRQSDFERAKRAHSMADLQANALERTLAKAHQIKEQVDLLYHLPQKLQEEIESYLDLYFVELYDPSLLQPGSENAGFTLHFKPQTSPLSWTKIHDESSLTQAINLFLSQIERKILEKEQWRSLEPLIQDLFSSWQELLRNPSFAAHAKGRLETAHQSSTLKTQVLSAWSYISGGTFHSLLEIYFGRKFYEKTLEISSPLDIVEKLVEFMKTIPPLYSNQALKDPRFHFFLSMPGHAMLFWPSAEPFKTLWSEKRPLLQLLQENRIPLIFADTNWEKNALALFQNPENHSPILVTFAEGGSTLSPLTEDLILGQWCLYIPF